MPGAMLVVADALASNGPPIRRLEERDRRHVLGGKPGDHGERFHRVDVSAATRIVERKQGGSRFRFLNGVPLNHANPDGEGNFLACRAVRPNGRTLHFSWVTDLAITESNACDLMRAGRARWRIENETFKPLKNQGDGLEHNHGHGRRHLATGFAQLMRRAFLIDPVQQRGGSLFRAARAKAGSSGARWERLSDGALEPIEDFRERVPKRRDREQRGGLVLQHVNPTSLKLRPVRLKVGHARNADALEITFGAQDFHEALRFRTCLRISVEMYDVIEIAWACSFRERSELLRECLGVTVG